MYYFYSYYSKYFSFFLFIIRYISLEYLHIKYNASDL